MLGGGTFTAMNKVLNGAYVNYVSAERASSSVSDRGVTALPIELNWGADGKVMEVSLADVQKNSLPIFGYAYDADEMKPIREVFKHSSTALFYKLNGGNNATCAISTASCKGIRGNDIKHVVVKNVDNQDLFDVSTYMGATLVDEQTVATAADLKDNDYVQFNKDATLEATAGIALNGGTNGEVTGTEHQAALDALEPYSFNTLGCMSETETIKALYVSFTKRMRNEVGVKFSLIVHQYKGDDIGVINVRNIVNDTSTAYALVPWVAGAEAGCPVNKTLENMTYDGEYNINASYKQSELTTMLENGEFVFHKVGNGVNVLSDINSFVSFTDDMPADFQLNQVIRVLDQIATDEAAIFNNKYLGKIQNDDDGRISFWGDCVDIHNDLLKLKAIEDFRPDDISIEKGKDKRSVIANGVVKPVCAMAKLYMTIYCK